MPDEYIDKQVRCAGGAAPMQRGASMTTDKHVDPAAAPSIIEEESQESPDTDIPEGALRFNLTAEEIKDAMMEISHEVRLFPSSSLRYIPSATGKA